MKLHDPAQRHDCILKVIREVYPAGFLSGEKLEQLYASAMSGEDTEGLIRVMKGQHSNDQYLLLWQIGIGFQIAAGAVTIIKAIMDISTSREPKPEFEEQRTKDVNSLEDRILEQFQRQYPDLAKNPEAALIISEIVCEIDFNGFSDR